MNDHQSNIMTSILDILMKNLDNTNSSKFEKFCFEIELLYQVPW